MLVRCLSVLTLSSAGLLALFAAAGEGPAIAVKERQVVALGLTGELPVGRQSAHRLAAVAPPATVSH
ncbi:hypothetical protein [Blastochloris sulfoviridis]|uniref:Uncharacterized protein n=1 Tax=Blastochloris sulfoviridis TaxID=50712 RepID=A0A5M6I4H3_9HYPH|nr:hypothetical protein [Blastochloris sulfoviridis]KAA5602699.1 hypothetical protein F1193_04235 [Blastochloris sulfoviridis]